MAIDTDAILTAVRDVVEDAAGSARTISSGRFEGGLYEDLSDDEKSRRSAYLPRVETSIVAIDKHPTDYHVMGTLRLYRIAVDVSVTRHADLEHKLTDSVRDDLMGLATQDVDILVQALTYPGNLTQDNDSNATGLVSGRMQFDSSEFDVLLGDDEPGLVKTLVHFGADVAVAQ